MTPGKIISIVICLECLAAAIAYSFQRDWHRAIYWLGSFAVIASVTF